MVISKLNKLNMFQGSPCLRGGEAGDPHVSKRDEAGDPMSPVTEQWHHR